MKTIMMVLGLALLAPMTRADEVSDRLDRIQRQLDGIESALDQAEWDRFHHRDDDCDITGWGRGFWPDHSKQGKRGH